MAAPAHPRNAAIKSVLRHALAALGFHVARLPAPSPNNPYSHAPVVPRASYSPWLDDPKFQETYKAISGNTLVDVYRCWEFWHLVEQVRHIPGDFLEVGVWRGGTGCLTAYRIEALGIDATIHLCDTFHGVVGSGAHDPDYRDGEHADTSADAVSDLAGRLGVAHRVVIHTGMFPEDTGNSIADRQFRMCHIDVDVYLSARSIFDWAWQRLNVGGVIVFDDYGFSTTAGVTRLVNELGSSEDRIWLHNLNGHAIVIKLR